jgi:hypothetical protein
MNRSAFYILLALVVLSLALNVVILVGLNAARQALVSALDTSLETISGLENEKFETTVQLRESVPVRIAVPFRRDLQVPIRTNIPIKEQLPFRDTLRIPIRTFVGEYNVSVPISTTVPINLDVPVDLQVPIDISETIDISTSVDLNLDIPVSIGVADSALADYLRELRATLTEIRKRLSFGGN